jgi:hypothetical protein
MAYSAIDAYCSICELIGDSCPDGDDESEANAAVVDAIDARFNAARAMLAALKAAETTLNNGAPITGGTRYNMRAAIAQAEAAGINTERQSTYGHDSGGTRVKA